MLYYLSQSFAVFIGILLSFKTYAALPLNSLLTDSDIYAWLLTLCAAFTCGLTTYSASKLCRKWTRHAWLLGIALAFTSGWLIGLLTNRILTET